jgi:hypothetical protein
MVYLYLSMAADHKNIHEVIRHFNPISLGEMDAVKLMNRTDTKYVFPSYKLGDLLALSWDKYLVLEINGCRDFRYNSLYYDTQDHAFYTAHHNGARPRFKVRFREYVETGTTFLEIKRKTNKERTRKTRIQVEGIEMVLSENSRQYIETQVPLKETDLKPAMWTIFQRITLVGKDSPERITIDHDLSFSYEDLHKQLLFLTICEVKREGFTGKSAFMKYLEELSIHPGNSSKYCLVTVLLKKNIKYNRFKRNILTLNRLENDYRSYPSAG